ncbi:sialic acid-binding Ig-like lectin 11 isoform X4 [Myotis daubentonii]|uniref:sialic acid-binding Ig-like lectin 11 isoform X4 n=1 Tax=Myotis daubentonii TaxID=98922 RepID=UPI0028730626|nr:sialic acid-binding Ig-like lectin 11 isoform X4 [Myotis daubentonii]
MLLLLLLLPLLPLLWAGSPQKDPEYQLQVQDSVTVQAGLCVHVPCKVSYPRVGWNDSTPAYGYWYQKRKAAGRDVLMATNNQDKKIKSNVKPPSPFDLSGDPGASNCSLSISAAGPGHSGKYYFRLERGPVNYSYQSNLLTVTVTALAQTPEIHVKKPLEAGRPGHLVCSLPGACAPLRPSTVSWAGAAALRTRALGSLASKSPDIVFKPRPQDHGTNLTCRVTFPGADVSRTITLNVSYAPQNLTISASRGSHTELEHVGNGSALSVREGDSLRLLCVADSNPPATLSWAQGNRSLSPSQPQEPGVLELPRVEERHEGEFTCRAQHPRGSLRASLRLQVQKPPQLLGPSCSWEDQGLHCSCSSRAQPAPSLRWRLGAGLLEGNHGNASHVVTSSSAGPWTNSSLSLREGLSPDLRLSCEARNVHGAQSASVLLLPGQGLLGAEATEEGVGKPALREAFVLGAVTGAGVVGLLGLCLIVFLVKTRRRGAPRAAAGEKDASSTRGSASSTRGSASSARSPASSMRSPASSTRSPASLGGQRERRPGSQLDHPPPAAPPAAATPASGEELELYYATLSFQGPRPGERPDEEATTSTEYAEIKIRT